MFLEYVSVFFCILMILSGYRLERNFYNPLVMFFGVFGLMILLSSLHLYNIFKTSQEVYSIIFIGLLSFTIGYFYFFFTKKKFYNENKVTTDTEVLNRKLVYIIYLLVIVFLLYRVIGVYQLLSQGYTYSYLRINLNESLNVSPIVSLFNQYFIKPMNFALIPIGIIEYFTGAKKIIFLSILVTILNMFIEGGRFTMMYFLVMFITMYLIQKEEIYISNKVKRRLVILLVVGVILVIVMTNLRGVEYSIFKHLYLYIAGAIPHFEYRLAQLKDLDYYTYGITSFRGFFLPIFLVLNELGIFSYPDILNNSMLITNSVNETVYIGTDNTFNSFVTIFHSFYLDGGILGVILGSLFYGIILSITYNHLKTTSSKISTAIYLLLIQGIFTSMVRWQFTTPAYALAFIFIFIFYKNRPVENTPLNKNLTS